MTPPTSIPSTATTSPSQTTRALERPRQAFPGLLSDSLGSMGRLVDLQVKIWLMGVKIAVFRAVMIGMLSAVALVLLIVAGIFMYAGLYHVLTDLLAIPTAWALLIFAGAHLFAAGILALIAIRLFTRRSRTRYSQGAAA